MHSHRLVLAPVIILVLPATILLAQHAAGPSIPLQGASPCSTLRSMPVTPPPSPTLVLNLLACQVP